MPGSGGSNAVAVAMATALAALSALTTFVTELSIWLKVACWLAAFGFALLAMRRSTWLEHRAARVDRWVRETRAAAAALVVVFCLAAAFVGIGISSRNSSSDPPASLAPISLDLDAALSVKNLTATGDDWGTQTEAYGGDDLAFDAVLRNRSDQDTGPLVAAIAVKDEPYGGERLPVDLVVGRAGMQVAAITSVDVTKRNCFGDLFGSAVQTVNLAGAETGPAPQPSLSVTPPDDGFHRTFVGEALIPTIESHSQAHVRYVASVDTGAGKTTFDSGPNVKVRNSSSSKYMNILNADQGDHLVISTLVHTGDCTTEIQRVPVRVRVAIQRQYATNSFTLTAFASGALSPMDDPPTPIGRAVINVPDARHTELSVVPGSTAVYGTRERCNKTEFLHNAQDGIAAGGTIIGDIYGYRPRDHCHTDSLGKFVVFEIALARS